MSKSRRVSRKPLFLILGLSLSLAIGYTVWNAYFRPQSVNIMAITPSALTYGDTTIEGTIQRNMSPEEKGSFILALRDTRVVKLDEKGLDHLLGLPVTIYGNLTPGINEFAPMTMSVQSIIVAQE